MQRVRQVSALAADYTHQALERYRALSSYGKAAVWGVVGLNVAMTAAMFYIGIDTIMEQFALWADYIAASPYGWLMLFGIIIVTSVPPLFGYGTAQTLVGFAYGVWPGFVISALSCLAGGAFSFIVVRHFLHFYAPFVQRMNTHKALSKAVRAKGLPLMMLLRLCPFPYPYSNAFFASIETVTLWQFLLATLHVFVGHRTYLMSDPGSRAKMDGVAKAVNIAFMVIGTLLGMATSWYLYKLTMRYVDEANEEQEQEELEAGLLDDVDELLASDSAAPSGTQTPVSAAVRGVKKADGEGDLLELRDGEGEADALRKAGVEDGDDENDGWDAQFGETPQIGTGGGGGAGRRDSEAWGLDLELDERGADSPEVPRRDKRID
ncbi:hypothetical protein Rhopal_004693-T1 [Rhodotorula paludigena]|uniref:Golgi apparatus membrane protein TVP38 n=1 Tax=Rhodotorula paludigena TaxID=86838 RepID=A0AAV5GGI1_9BASI|nr:hypothetical protein Rhopal_004693-T1 [Rhodotorula paludigena]